MSHTYRAVCARLCCFLALLLAGASARAETIPLVTYYLFAPWCDDAACQRGLNAELARRLTALSAGRYSFISTPMPRRRLDKRLVDHDRLVVPWVSPRFFNDANESQYRWTRPLMQDESLVVSAKRNPVDYDGPESLRGKRFAAGAGHHFPDLDPLIEAGEITRVDVPQSTNALKMLGAGHDVDFTVIDQSSLIALRQDPSIDFATLHIAPRPRTTRYPRRILVPNDAADLHYFIDTALAKLANDRSWKEMLASYEGIKSGN